MVASVLFASSSFYGYYITFKTAARLYHCLCSINMKKYRKIIICSFFIALVTGIVSLLAFIIYLETSIDRLMSKKRQERLFAEIRDSKALPDSFYRVLNKYYPTYFEQGVWDSVFRQLTGGQRNKCQCREIYIHPGHTDNWVPFAQEIVALELQDNFSQKKCYEYTMSVSDFGSNKTGIYEAAQFFYNKRLLELNEREILELNIIRIAPIHYSPFTNKENLDKAVNNIINIELGI